MPDKGKESVEFPWAMFLSVLRGTDRLTCFVCIPSPDEEEEENVNGAALGKEHEAEGGKQVDVTSWQAPTQRP